MMRVEQTSSEEMVSVQDVWQKICHDVEDLANNVGMDAAEALVEELLGAEWQNETGYKREL
jgi:hypothetical protein